MTNQEIEEQKALVAGLIKAQLDSFIGDSINSKTLAAMQSAANMVIRKYIQDGNSPLPVNPNVRITGNEVSVDWISINGTI